MNTFARNSGAASSSPGFVTLLITLVLGFAVGFFVCYAWLSPRLGEPRNVPTPVAEVPVVPAPGEIALTGLLELRPGRHLFLGVEGKDLSPAYAELLGHIRPGGVVLRPENVESPEQASRLVTQIKKALGEGTGATDPPLILGDPDALGMGVSAPFAELVTAGDAGQALEAGRAVAAAFQTYGIRVAFGPSLATVSGGDSDILSAVGLAYADGLAQGGVLPVAKGYPGIGSIDRVEVLAQDVTGLASLLLPFTEALGHRIPGVFVEHVAVPALDIRYPERPASLSPVLVRRLLRGGAKPYEGVVVAADMAAPALSPGYRPEGAAVEALIAGCDAVVYLDVDPARIRAMCASIVRAVQEGILTRDRLDESKSRLDGWQEWIADPKPLEGPLPDMRPLTGSDVSQTPTAPVIMPEPAQTPAIPVETEAAEPVEPVAAPEVEQTPTAPVAMEEAPAPEPEPAPIETAAPADETEASGDVAPPGTERVVYTIQEGDRLYRIAKRFGVSADDIVKWNDLPDQNIKFGRKLVIHTPNAQAPAETGAGLPAEVTESAPAPAPEPAPEPVPVAEEAAAPIAPPAPEVPVPAPAEGEAAPPAEPQATETETAEAPGKPIAIAEVEEGLVRIEYEIQRGEMLSRLAKQYGVKQSDIVKWNKLSNPNVQRGQRLILFVKPEMTGKPAAEVEEPAADVATVPVPDLAAPATYRVQPGDTASSLARTYGVSVKQLLELNGINDPDRILVDQVIKVPR